MTVSRIIRELPRARNLVLLASDMKGFTARTSRQTREENERMLSLHDALLVPVIRRYGGRKLKAIGDALLAAFESPTDAVLCAMAMQDRLAQFNSEVEEEERIEVRIALSQGEVRIEGGDVHGDPVQLALEAQAVAEVGDVVLTDAVYLSMNKREAPTEVLAHRLLHGGGSIRLRRALRGPDPLNPYGGRALARIGRLRTPGRLVNWKGSAASAIRAGRRRIAWLVAASLVLTAGTGNYEPRSIHDPLVRAAGLLDERQPTAALAELDKLAESPEARDARVQVLRAKAEHAVGLLGPAFSDFEAAARTNPAVLDSGALQALADQLDAESFPDVWRPALVRLLGEKVGRACAPMMRPLLESPRGRSRDDALQVLELAGAATDDDRLLVARADLMDDEASCARRKRAVHRLGMVRDVRAQVLLERATSSPGCAAREARDELRQLTRRLASN